MSKAKYAVRFRRINDGNEDGWSFIDDLYGTESEAKAKVMEHVASDVENRETYEYVICAVAEIIRHKQKVVHSWERT